MYVYKYHILLTQSCITLEFLFLRKYKKNPAMNMGTQISLETLLTILNIYPEVELLNQMVI